MVLDASAIIAMLGVEAEGDRFAIALDRAGTRSISPVAVWEAVAYDQFGKGRHPARLNLGDCFAYAAAMAESAPLLHRDEGFWLTDIGQALERPED
jgi:ribonuclease VapC